MTFRTFMAWTLPIALILGFVALQSFGHQSNLEPRKVDDETVSYLIWDERRYAGSLHRFKDHPEWHVRLPDNAYIWRSYKDQRQHKEDYKNLKAAISLPELSWVSERAKLEDDNIALVRFLPRYVPKGRPEFNDKHGSSHLGDHEFMVNYMCHLAEEIEIGIFRVRNRTPEEIQVSRENPRISTRGTRIGDLTAAIVEEAYRNPQLPSTPLWSQCEGAGDPRLRLQLYRGEMEPAGIGVCEYRDKGECTLTIWYPVNRNVQIKLDRSFLHLFSQLDSMISAEISMSETEDPIVFHSD